VAKAEWGLKRTCQSCNAKFYDMNRTPIVCPKCGAAFDPEALMKARRTKIAGLKSAPEDEAEAEDGDVGVDADDKAEDEEGVMEDTSELGGDSDDVDDVVDGSDGPREDR
jgi:uncharacterized protein (TIGR02300 family)